MRTSVHVQNFFSRLTFSTIPSDHHCLLAFTQCSSGYYWWATINVSLTSENVDQNVRVWQLLQTVRCLINSGCVPMHIFLEFSLSALQTRDNLSSTHDLHLPVWPWLWSPARPIFFLRIDDSHSNKIYFLSHCCPLLWQCLCRKHPVAWKKYYMKYR